MNIIIYNINSFGGNYNYSKYIFEAYSNNCRIKSCTLLLPANASANDLNIIKLLLADVVNSKNKLIRKLYYLYRSFINPLRLLRYLQKQPSSIVLFNDFDQHTATFWAPFFHLLKSKHRFGVYLHDPDRDAFFPVKFLSVSTMKSVMSFMDVAFYHGYLPDKIYYTGNFLKVKVPHGIYTDTTVDEEVVHRIKNRSDNFPILGILGNIREEKNYELIIDAVSKIKDVKLLIAGQPSNSGVSIKYYKSYAAKKNVADRIIWIIEYLPIASFNAAIQSCEIILLCYKESFTSQSGILNSIAPFKKKMIITNTKSSLKECVEEYHLGEIVPDNNLEALVLAIRKLLSSTNSNQSINWQNYMNELSWETHANIALDSFNMVS